MPVAQSETPSSSPALGSLADKKLPRRFGWEGYSRIRPRVRAGRDCGDLPQHSTFGYHFHGNGTASTATFMKQRVPKLFPYVKCFVETLALRHDDCRELCPLKDKNNDVCHSTWLVQIETTECNDVICSHR